jgi:hypothetical protein
MQRAILPGATAGKSLDNITKMSEKLMAVAKAGFGMSAEFAGREFAEIMEGRASSRVRLFGVMKQFLKVDDAPRFNALSAPERWNRIEKALEHFNPMLEEFGNTWTAIQTTTTTIFNNMIRMGSAPLFEYLKKELAELNDWANKNQEMIERMGRTLATSVIDGFKAIKDVVSFIVQHRDTMIAIAEAHAAIRVGQSFGGSGTLGLADFGLAGGWQKYRHGVFGCD